MINKAKEYPKMTNDEYLEKISILLEPVTDNRVLRRILIYAERIVKEYSK